MPKVTINCIPSDVIQACTALREIDLSPFSQIQKLSYSSFLVICTSMTALDLSSLSQLTEVPANFLFGCTGLTTLDLSPLSQVRVIKGEFLEGCTGINAVDSPPPHHCVTPQGDGQEWATNGYGISGPFMGLYVCRCYPLLSYSSHLSLYSPNRACEVDSEGGTIVLLPLIVVTACITNSCSVRWNN